VWWHHSGVIDVMPNASNTGSVLNALGGDDITTQRAVIAVQGPGAKEIAALVCPSFGTVGRFRVEEIVWNGVECTVAGTGYTGEPGLEISIPAGDAAELWHALAEAGATSAGLGARDTLRLEAGLPLHGQELGPDITPFQAGLGSVVAFDTDFIGKDALLAEKDAGLSRRLVGIATEGRRPPRTGNPIVCNGQQIGHVTSGNFSPMLQHGIAMGFISRDLAIGDAVTIDIRGSEVTGSLVKLPFV
ncbi:MAG: glycine cleavage T C-terminal barrel domain-containing protein, partial [Actinomycetota bacterium]|nr:glycine cleavage T C-terminal barrel domain-containing protein [Actinomycetota bacterium]